MNNAPQNLTNPARSGATHTLSKSILATALILMAAGCAAPPKAPSGPSAFDLSLEKAVQQVAGVTAQLRENQGNPPPGQANGFPLPKTVTLPAPVVDSKITPPPRATPPQPEKAPVETPRAGLDNEVSIHVVAMPIDTVLKLLAEQLGWTYAHNGNPSGIKITLSAKKQTIRTVLEEISKQMPKDATLHVESVSGMILLHVGD